jgi:dTMP kinase
VILASIKGGKIVIFDRFTDWSEAYQGRGRHLGSKNVLALHNIICGGLQPDLTILLVSDVNASVQRARNRNRRARGDEGRFERETADFFRRVLKAYLAIAQREPQRVVKIKAAQSIADVHKEVMKVFRSRFPQKKAAK